MGRGGRDPPTGSLGRVRGCGMVTLGYETGRARGLARMKRLLMIGVSFAGLPVLAGAAYAQSVVPGFDANQLARNDDGSTGEVALPFTANFFGTTYSSLYVNNNGNVTFGTPLSTFTPVGLGANYRGAPIIAPFFSDVDTRNPASGITSYGTGTYAGQTAFGVTWPSVGYFSNHADKTNTFQLVLASRADTGGGNFDIYFNYQRIQFETGDASGGTNGLGGTSASAGYSAGTGAAGSYFELPGSLVNGALIDGGPNSLVAGSNNGVPGQFLFPVRNGVVMLANVCQPGDNASTTQIANCGPNRAYTGGIFYTPLDKFTLNVLDNTTIAGPQNAAAVLVMPTAATTGASPAGSVAINVNASATITAPGGAGIQIDSGSGTGAGSVTSAGTITAATAGIQADTNRGALTVANSGTITAPLGISGSSRTTTALSNSGTLNASYAGLVGGGFTGTVTLTNTGTVNYGQFGILGGSAVAPLVISNAGALTQSATASGPPATGLPTLIAGFLQTNANPSAIFARAGGAISIENGANGTIAGANGIDAAVLSSVPGLPATGAATGPLTITNLGTIDVQGAAITTAASAVASQVTNAGTLTGSLALSSGSTFTNTASGRVNVTGASSFGGGTITNAGGISLASTSLQNLSGFQNQGSGLLIATGTSSIGSQTQGTSFVNAGTISLVNGRAGDTLTINGNYVGQNGRLLAEFNTQTSTGDRLIINGNASGTTGVTVTNLTGAVPFTTGSPIVTVTGTSAANAFTLAGAQNFGTLEAILVATTGQGGTSVALGTVPTAVGLSASTAVIAARTIAFQGGSAVLDRLTQVRDSLKAAPGQTAIPQAMQYNGLSAYSALVTKDPIAPKLAEPAPQTTTRPAIWARAYGDIESRSGFSNFSFGGLNFTRDLGYSQVSGGFLGGTDVVISGLTKPDDGLILGVMGGYTLAGVDLNRNAGRQDYEGGTVGVYGTYLNGPWFWDALFKVDLLGLDIRAPGVVQRTGLQNYNFTTNVGYRVPLEHNIYVEPTAGLEYVSTVFDRTPALAVGAVPLRDGEALRGRIGARIGTEMVEDNIRIEPSITGYVYSVLTETGTVGAFNGITGVTGLREEGKVRGEVQASINFFNLKTGLSGFIRGDYRIGGDLVGGGGRAGIRYQFSTF
ncbi:outer membrane autotransporter barrel domain protein [Methylobacterium sp. 4-46]|nr:outer membrane autotransporter barrel domain protein [Methylobacterium sp. 4-46]